MKRKRHTVCTKFKTRREVALLCFSEKSPSNAVNCLRRWINSDPELLVHLERARDGKRQVAEIAEILGFAEGEVRMHGLYKREKDQLKKTGELAHREKLERCFGENEL